MHRYLKQVFKKIKNNPFHFLVSSLGLFIGLTVLLLISSFIHKELQYDQQFSKYEQIYLVGVKDHNQQTKYLINSHIGPSLKDDITGIEDIHFYNVFDADIQRQDDEFKVSMSLVDSAFFKTFDFPVISGSKQALQNISPGHAVITDQLAEKIFGRTDVAGATFFQKDAMGFVDTYIIDGTIRVPDNTSIRADVFVSDKMRVAPYRWKQPALMIYQWVVLKDGVDPGNLRENLRTFSLSHGMPEGVTIEMAALRDIHFSKNAELQLVFQTRNVQILYLLIFVTLMVLMIVVINHINFSLHHSLNQSKEIGVRKAMGAQRVDLTRLFLSDNSISFLIALPLAYYTALRLLPLFGNFLGVHLDSASLLNAGSIFTVTVTVIVLIFTSYLYYISLIRQKVPGLMKSSQQTRGSSFGLRKALVITQIGLSATMVIISIGIYRQANMLKEMPIGFNSDYLITLPKAQLREKYITFKTGVLENPDVLSYTTSTVEIGALQRKPDTDSVNETIQTIVADFDFMRTLGIRMVAGQDFNKDNQFQRKYSADYMLFEEGKEAEFQKKLRERPIIVSENLVKAFGIENPLGTVFSDARGAVYGTIIGVCASFELGPQKTKNSLKVIMGDHDMFYGGFGHARIMNANIDKTLSHIEKVWKQYLPDKTFDFAFADSKMDRLYKTETALTTLTISFTVLSIILSALGVLGLFVILISRRTKEIGIRKILGASVSRITLLMMRDTLAPAIVAIAIAIPVGAIILHFWLLDYAYRIGMSWWIFVSAALGTLLIISIPVVLKTLQAARANPVNSLRAE